MEEALIKRVLPHSIEAEQSVVGAMLMDKEAILTASEIITGQDFYQTGTPERKGCTGRDIQSGICPRAGGSCADFCQCKILCADRI